MLNILFHPAADTARRTSPGRRSARRCRGGTADLAGPIADATPLTQSPNQDQLPLDLRLYR